MKQERTRYKISGKKIAAVFSVSLLHAVLVAVLFCEDHFRKISICTGISLLCPSMNELPWMKNMTRRVGGTGCSAHVPPAPGVSSWKDTRCQC